METNIIPQYERIGVLVSGGTDSTLLLYQLSKTHPKSKLYLWSGSRLDDGQFNLKHINDILVELKLNNIVLSAKSENLNIDQSINFKNLEFKNIGNTKDSKDYKTVLKETIKKAMKDMKNKVLSGNVGNTLDKVKNIDQNKIKEKIKKELFENKDKVKDKLKKLLNKN